MGPLIPLFWTSGEVCPGFQSLLASFLPVVIFSFTPSVTPVDFTHRSDSNQCSASIAIFLSLISLFIGQHLEI